MPPLILPSCRRRYHRIISQLVRAKRFRLGN
jgi:hypothetical protein